MKALGKIVLNPIESLTISESKQVIRDLRDLIEKHDSIYYQNKDNFGAMEYEDFYWFFHNRVKDSYET